jgi:hypothetical protein
MQQSARIRSNTPAGKSGQIFDAVPTLRSVLVSARRPGRPVDGNRAACLFPIKKDLSELYAWFHLKSIGNSAQQQCIVQEIANSDFTASSEE